MRPNPHEPAFAVLKLKLYKLGLLLGTLTTTIITLVWWLGEIEMQVDDIIAPAMVIYCLAFYFTLRSSGSRCLQVFETSAMVILFGYFLSGSYLHHLARFRSSPDRFRYFHPLAPRALPDCIPCLSLEG